ncbi:lysine--tRNA ligase [Clostridium sediminicola]|uniref:lysine--tRNA ligase n=1 Tax=Clostridium sediminicola TaxID=3114879 RepID=UPI0031F276D5
MYTRYTDIENLKEIMPDANEYNVNRIAKINRIHENGRNPYPYSFRDTTHIYYILDKFEAIEDEDIFSIAGRIMLIRDMGKTIFMNIKDESGNIQLYLNAKLLGKEDFSEVKNLDVGDIIGTIGTIFKTKTGEITLRVKELVLLTKSIRPLPEKFHGIQDVELRERYRSLDMIMNDDVKNRFINRSRAITAIRDFLNSRGYYEVDTPILDTKYGGGEAKPFVTHVNALNTDAYLTVSPELFLKRFIVGGIEKVYTFCRAFRNEGIDRTHYPEFTLLECYQAYSDYRDMMELMENVYDNTFRKVLGSTVVNIERVSVDFKAPWRRVTMYDLVNEELGIELNSMNEIQIKEYVTENNLFPQMQLNKSQVEDMSKGYLILNLFETFCESKIIQPTFVIDYPYETSPLCKTHRENTELIERFEPFAAGVELGNAYSELNDPIRQRELLKEQSDKLRAGLETASPMDEEFARAVDVGMPPTGGLGVGIDRLIMFLTEASSIKDVIAFPITKR